MRPFFSPLVAGPARSHVVLFDGQCGLCRAGVAGLRRWARPAAIEFRDFREPCVLARSATCPLCRKYGPTLARLAERWSGRGVRFPVLGVCSTTETFIIDGAQEANP